MITNNAGLRALTTSQERKEIRAVFPTMPLKASSNAFEGLNHDKACKIAHLRLKAAFIQKGWEGVPDTQYWHVLSEGPSKHSTLSMEGLKQWKLL